VAAEVKLLTGTDIRCLMRRYKLTIREVAARGQLTLKRVREVRLNGVRGKGYVQDWLELLRPKS
jgi:hypothetical protein